MKKTIAGAFVTLFIILFSGVSLANLLPNPGFEEGTNGTPSDWLLIAGTDPEGNTLNSIDWITSGQHAGLYALQFNGVEAIVGKSVLIQSPRINVPENSLVNVGAWIKAIDVDRCGLNDSDPGCKSWNHLRITLVAFDAENQKIRHWDTVSTDGNLCGYIVTRTCDWREVSSNIVMPAGTDNVLVQIKLDHSTGTVWVDDVSLSIAQVQPVPDTSGITGPVILPEPWLFASDQSSALIGDVAITNLTNDTILLSELEKFFLSNGISYFVDPSDPSQYATHLLLGDASNQEISDNFAAKYPGQQWADIGEQGYFLAVELNPDNKIYIAGNTEQGRFYGLQSLKQLIANGYIYTADVLDKPDLKRRGMVMGVQWYSRQVNAIDRFVSLKGNYILNHGSFLSNKLLRRWREPFTASNLTSLQNYFNYATERFIEPHINFGPRSCSIASQCENLIEGIDYGPTQYSNDAEINLIVEKISQLYALGFRSFGLTFDDTHNSGEDALSWSSDIKKFQDSIGKAHSYYTKQVYRRIIKLHPDIRFSLLPLWYGAISNSGDNKIEYIRELDRLPTAVEIITVPNVDQSVTLINDLLGRPTSVWTNFFAPSKTNVEYILPYINYINWDDVRLTDYMFLPSTPTAEEFSLTSWYTAMDFAWSPYRYDADRSFQNNAARYERSIAP